MIENLRLPPTRAVGISPNILRVEWYRCASQVASDQCFTSDMDRARPMHNGSTPPPAGWAGGREPAVPAPMIPMFRQSRALWVGALRD
jgi:hypothetical protein